MDEGEDPGLGDCEVCYEEKPWRWKHPDNYGHYCILCIAERLKKIILVNIEDTWPPRLENATIPVAALTAKLEEAEDHREDDRIDGSPVIKRPYQGLLASFREMDRYRGAVPNSNNRIFCPHRRHIESRGRPGWLLEMDDERCNHFIGERVPLEEGGLHLWADCGWCYEFVCRKCGRGQSDSDSHASAHEDAMCTRSQEMTDTQLDPEKRGTAYQTCPSCGRDCYPFEGCNHLPCPCGTSFCLICGSELPCDQGAGGHYVPGMPCPRYNAPNDPNAIWAGPADSEPVRPQIPGFPPDDVDAINFDGSEYDERIHASVIQRWRAAERLVIDSAAHIMNLQLHEDEEKNTWYLAWIFRLMIAARHMFRMISNGVDFDDITPSGQRDAIVRRIRFTHHACNFQFGLRMIRRNRAPDFEIPGGNESFDVLLPYTLPLKFQQNAVPESADVRSSEWRRFRRIVEDQLDVQNPTTYLMELADRDARLELRRATQTRLLLEPIRAMVPIFDRHRYPIRKAFNIADSATLRTHREELQSRLRALAEAPGGMIAFQLINRESSAVLNIAELFAHRLLDDADGVLPQPPSLAWFDQPDEWAAEQVYAGLWAAELLEVIRDDADITNYLSPDEMPPRVPELHRLLEALSAAIMDFRYGENWPSQISDHHLLNVRRIGLAHMQWTTPPKYDILPGNRPLRAVFYRAYSVLNNTEELLDDRHPSARSSVSSNADNTIRQKIAWIEGSQERLLERRVQDGPPSTSHFFILDVLTRFRYLLQRMDMPDEYDNSRNQEYFDWLWNVLRRHHLDMLTDEETSAELRPRWRPIARGLTRWMAIALGNMEVNPAGQERHQGREELDRHVLEVETLQADQPDTDYLRAFQQRLYNRQDLLEHPDRPEFQALAEYLEALREASEYEALLHVLQDDGAGIAIRSRFRRSLRRFRVEDTLIGHMHNYQRLAPIFTRVMTWVDTFDPLESEGDLSGEQGEGEE